MEQKFEVVFPHWVFGFLFYRAIKLVAMSQLVDMFIQYLLYVLYLLSAILAVGLLQILVSFLPDLS